MQIIVYHSKARKTMCGMGTFCLIGMISLQLTIQNGEIGTRKVTGVIKDNTRRGLYCGMDFSDAPADGWLVLIYCFTESNSTGFCIAFGVNGKSEGHIYGFIYSGGWTDYVINFC